MNFLRTILISAIALLKATEGVGITGNEQEKNNLPSFGPYKTSNRRGNVSNLYCEHGWYSFGNMCYKLEGEKRKEWLSFDLAEELCVQEGGHLVTINSAGLNEFLLVHLLFQIETHVWIGLHDKLSEMDFKWTDHTPVNYTNWRDGEPSGKGGGNHEEDCVEMDYSFKPQNLGKWNDLGCSSTRPFICQRARDRDHYEVDPRRCEKGFRLRASCFIFVNAEKTWQEAEDHCAKNYHGHLAAVTDFSVKMFLDYVLVHDTPDKYNSLWIGLRLTTGRTVMKWSSGWYLAYTNWRENVTESDISHHYCSVRTKDGYWDAVTCENRHPFVCEQSSDIAPKLTEASEKSSCPSESKDWLDLGGNFCYIFETKTYITWYEANFICILNGGTLASIHSNAELMSIEQFLRHKGYYFHIGFHRKPKSKNDTFVWADGTAVDFSPWGHDEPNSKLEKCTELRLETLDWNDIKCENTRIGFICSAEKVNYVLKNLTLESDNGGCGYALSTAAILGIVFCVLLMVALIMVVIYNVIPRESDHRNSRKSSRPPTLQGSSSHYRSADIVITEESETEDMMY